MVAALPWESIREIFLLNMINSKRLNRACHELDSYSMGGHSVGQLEIVNTSTGIASRNGDSHNLQNGSTITSSIKRLFSRIFLETKLPVPHLVEATQFVPIKLEIKKVQEEISIVSSLANTLNSAYIKVQENKDTFEEQSRDLSINPCRFYNEYKSLIYLTTIHDDVHCSSLTPLPSELIDSIIVQRTIEFMDSRFSPIIYYGSNHSTDYDAIIPRYYDAKRELERRIAFRAVNSGKTPKTNGKSGLDQFLSKYNSGHHQDHVTNDHHVGLKGGKGKKSDRPPPKRAKKGKGKHKLKTGYNDLVAPQNQIPDFLCSGTNFILGRARYVYDDGPIRHSYSFQYYDSPSGEPCAIALLSNLGCSCDEISEFARSSVHVNSDGGAFVTEIKHFLEKKKITVNVHLFYTFYIHSIWGPRDDPVKVKLAPHIGIYLTVTDEDRANYCELFIDNFSHVHFKTRLRDESHIFRMVPFSNDEIVKHKRVPQESVFHGCISRFDIVEDVDDDIPPPPELGLPSSSGLPSAPWAPSRACADHSSHHGSSLPSERTGIRPVEIPHHVPYEIPQSNESRSLTFNNGGFPYFRKKQRPFKVQYTRVTYRNGWSRIFHDKDSSLTIDDSGHRYYATLVDGDKFYSITNWSDTRMITPDICRFVEVPDGEKVMIKKGSECDDEMYGDYNCGCCCVGFTIQCMLFGRLFGIGTRPWFHSKQAGYDRKCFFGCGPIRPDTLYNLPKTGFLNDFRGITETTIAIPIGTLPTIDIPQDHEAHDLFEFDLLPVTNKILGFASINQTDLRQDVVLQPLKVKDVTYFFQETDRIMIFGGVLWKEFRAGRTRATTTLSNELETHCFATAGDVTIIPDEDPDRSVTQIDINGDTVRIPTKVYNTCNRIANTYQSEESTKEALIVVLTNKVASHEYFMLPPQAMAAVVSHFIGYQHRYKKFSSARVYSSNVGSREHETRVKTKRKHRGHNKSKGLVVHDMKSAFVDKYREVRYCCQCRGLAPKKYHWRHGLCEVCYPLHHQKGLKNMVGDSSIRGKARMYGDLTQPNALSIGIHHFPCPVYMLPVAPTPKIKPIRERCKREVDSLSKYDIGYTKARRPKVIDPDNVICPKLVGIGCATRVGVYIMDSNTESIALDTRLFARPESAGSPLAYTRLYELIVKMEIIEPLDYDFYPLPLAYQDECPFYSLYYQMGGNIKYDPSNKELLGTNLEVLRGLGIEVVPGHFYDKHGRPQIRTDRVNSWIFSFPAKRKKEFWDAIVALDMTTRHYKFDFFIKKELAVQGPRFGVNETCAANPRVICSPANITHIMMGPYTKRLTHLLHSQWGVESFITYAGGLSPAQMLSWLNKHVQPSCVEFTKIGMVAVENDFSKFDCTYNANTLDLILAVYRLWGFDIMGTPHFEQLRRIWHSWSRPCGYTSSGRTIKAALMNASGRDDTALMNALVNGCVQIYAYLCVMFEVNDPNTLNSAQLSWFKENVAIIVLGDDSLTILPERNYRGSRWDQKQVGDYVALFGFEARDMKVHRFPYDSVFLGCRPYPAIYNFLNKATGLVESRQVAAWGPTIGRRLVRFSTMIPSSEGVDAFAWLKGVNISTMTAYGFVPILSDITTRMLELNLTRQETPVSVVDRHKMMMFMPGLEEVTRNNNQRGNVYEGTTMSIVERVYKFTEMMRCYLRFQLKQITSLPAVIVSPILEEIINKDT